MTATTLLVIGFLGFTVLFGLALVEQRRIATTFRQRLLLPMLALIVPFQVLLALWAYDEEVKFVFGLALCLFVLIGFIVVAVTRLRAGPR